MKDWKAIHAKCSFMVGKFENYRKNEIGWTFLELNIDNW